MTRAKQAASETALFVRMMVCPRHCAEEPGGLLHTQELFMSQTIEAFDPRVVLLTSMMGATRRETRRAMGRMDGKMTTMGKIEELADEYGYKVVAGPAFEMIDDEQRETVRYWFIDQD
jgi:hypothetical protein